MGRKRRILNAADEYAALVRMAGEAGEKTERIYGELVAAEKEAHQLNDRLREAQRKLTAATAPRGAGVNSQAECSETGR